MLVGMVSEQLTLDDDCCDKGGDERARAEEARMVRAQQSKA